MAARMNGNANPGSPQSEPWFSGKGKSRNCSFFFWVIVGREDPAGRMDYATVTSSRSIPGIVY